MLNKLYTGYQIQKAFADSKIDNKHTFMSTRKVLQLAHTYFALPTPSQKASFNIKINLQNDHNSRISISITPPATTNSKNKGNSEKRNLLLQSILEKLREHRLVCRIKTLVLCHAIVKKTADEQFMQIMEDELGAYIIQAHFNEEKQHTTNYRTEVEVKGKQQAQHMETEFIQKKIISVYSFYLKKLVLNIRTYQYACSFAPLNKIVEEEVMEVVSHGFIVLNLINYILESQGTFNKMGRYFPEREEMLNVFIMYINDLIVYNMFVKNIVELSLKELVSSCSPQTMKHHYLFITQAQKSSDRLYEFFYNRYYYKRVKEIVSIPTFLQIHSCEFKLVAQHVKKLDKQFLLLVDSSKYTVQQRSRGRSKTELTMLEERRQSMGRTETGREGKLGEGSFVSYIKEQSFAGLGEGEQEWVQVKTIKISRKG